MTSFGYWADRVPTGQFLCVLCFEAFPLSEAAENYGDKVDVCASCWAAEGESEGRI